MVTRGRFLVATIALSPLILGACTSSKTMADAARAASQQLATVQRDLHAKVKAENAYYTSARASVVRAIDRAREDDLLFRLADTGRKFASGSAGSSPAGLGSRLRQTMTKTADDWQDAEAERTSLLNKTLTELDEKRKALELAEAEYKTLQTKLRSLAQARTEKETVAFVVGFVKSTKTALDEAAAQAAAAAEAAENATGDSGGGSTGN